MVILERMSKLKHILLRISRFGSRMGMLLYENCRGVDNSLVQNKGPPKSLSVEDSFQPCSSFKQAGVIIYDL